MSNLLLPTEIFVPRYLQFHTVLDEHERAHWIPDEADLRVDTEQWKNGTITPDEKAYIKNVLRLFTQADTDICGMYVSRLLPVFGNADARMMLLSFASREVTHIKGYKRLNDTLGYDSAEFMSEFLSFKEMKDKHDFMLDEVQLDTPSDIAEYLAKQILMEGVNLFASFVMLLSWSQQGKLPGMVSINQWSIKDESLHVRGLCAILQAFLEENPKVVNNHFKAKVYETAREVIRLEEAFIDLSYSVGKNPNVTAQEVKDYVRLTCDYRMQQMGLKPQFGIKHNPTPWMDLITSNTFANFFEATSVQYSKGSMVGAWEYA
jgi:ribonucleoside-diphosphate reductase beta chain